MPRSTLKKRLQTCTPMWKRVIYFPMDVALAQLPTPITNAAKPTVAYVRQISKDARFTKELVTWLVEESRQRHRKRANDN